MTDSSHPDLVVFRVARTPFEARVIVAVLADAGVPAFVPGGSLADEFAASQRLMNLQSVDVKVPGDRIEDAERALAAAKASGEELLDDVAAAPDGEAEVEPPDREPAPPVRGSGLTTKMALGALALFFGYMWLETRIELEEMSTSPLTRARRMEEGFDYRWNHNLEPAFRSFDRDANGIAEELWSFNREGRLLSKAYDADQNGIHERVELFDRAGGLRQTITDEDQDGVPENAREVLADGVTAVWRDTDGDGGIDRAELLDADGVTRRVQRLRGIEGFVTVQ